MGRPLCEHPSTTLHFVDDRLDTLKAVLRHPDLAARWKLYLASWGYCTASEVEAARLTPGVKVLQLPDFVELLKFGLVMQVGRACSGAGRTALCRYCCCCCWSKCVAPAEGLTDGLVMSSCSKLGPQLATGDRWC